MLERMSKIANQPRSLGDRIKAMNYLYQTNSYSPPVESAPPELKTDEES